MHFVQIRQDLWMQAENQTAAITERTAVVSCCKDCCRASESMLHCEPRILWFAARDLRHDSLQYSHLLCLRTRSVRVLKIERCNLISALLRERVPSCGGGSIPINTLLSWHTRIAVWSLTNVSFSTLHRSPSPQQGCMLRSNSPRRENMHGCRLRNYYSALLNAAMQTPVATPSKPAALQSESPWRHF